MRPSPRCPCSSPRTARNARTWFGEAFAVSEAYDTPVIVRLTTRISHSKGIVECGNREEVGIKDYVKDAAKYVGVPANAANSG
jgi:indolepyruvate ferredoxin oxidoreductase alpha subunit